MKALWIPEVTKKREDGLAVISESLSSCRHGKSGWAVAFFCWMQSNQIHFRSALNFLGGCSQMQVWTWLRRRVELIIICQSWCFLCVFLGPVCQQQKAIQLRSMKLFESINEYLQCFSWLLRTMAELWKWKYSAQTNIFSKFYLYRRGVSLKSGNIKKEWKRVS